MNTNRIQRTMALLLVIAAIIIAAPFSAEAAGTASGTAIGNNATVSYDVSGVPQTPISTGPTATFVVDTKVNLTVTTTNGSYLSTSPSSTSQVLTFTVKNNSNATQDFSLAAAAATDPFNGNAADTFDATNVQVFVETNGTPGYQAGADTATFIDELVSDATATVYIVADIPAGRVTNDIAAYALVATAYNAGGAGLGSLTAATVGANNLLSVDVVFADAANANVPTDTLHDGKASDRSAYKVSGAGLSITKTAVVFSDPFNASNPKMIPGAVITYTITVTNAAGGANATNVSITDSLNAEIVAGRLSFNTQFDDGSPACSPLYGIVVSGVCKTNAGGDDNADFGATAANTVLVSGLTVTAGTSVPVKFQVVVQ